MNALVGQGDIDRSDAKVLDVLRQARRGLTVASIAESARVSPRKVRQVLNSLKAQGFARDWNAQARADHPPRWEWELTDRGRGYAEAVPPAERPKVPLIRQRFHDLERDVPVEGAR
jgi:DNA-binding HxlR family transcriptional regulator